MKNVESNLEKKYWCEECETPMAVSVRGIKVTVACKACGNCICLNSTDKTDA